MLQPAPFATLRARRIVLVKPSALGDVAQALPVLAALRDRFPKAHIAWVVNDAYAPLLQPIPELDEVIPFPRGSLRKLGWRAAGTFVAFLRGLAARRFDLCIDLQGLARSGAMTWATRARRRLGLASAREGARWAYTDIVPDGPSPAAVDRYWRIAELFGVGHLPKRFPLHLTEAELADAAVRLAGLPRPIVAANPGARWETKRWPAEHFAAALRGAAGAFGSVAVLGGPGEEAAAAAVASQVAEALPGTPLANLCGQLTLRQLAAVLRSCDGLLTNDSGPMHLAAAVGTPAAAVFTCTAPERAGPHGPGHRILQTAVPCRASYLKRCSRMDCMRDCTGEQMAPLLTQILPPADERLPADRRDAAAAAA